MFSRNTVLIVDDEEINRSILCQMFQRKYTVLEAENGQQALELITEKEDSIAVVLLDIMMPGIDGFGVMEEMRRRGLLGIIPVVLITGDSSLESAKRAYDSGTSDIIKKPFDPSIVDRRVENIIELYQHKNHLESLVKLQTKKIEEQAKTLKEYDSFLIDTLSTVVEFRNLESGQHIFRIRGFTKVLLQYVAKNDPELGLSSDSIEMISSASALHDIGKIAIPDAILLKPGRLTPGEFDVMKTHTLKGCEILDSMTYFKDKDYFRYSYDICRHHHERWDGNGYPDRLKGDEIPLCAQVVSIADVFDALVSERVYKPPYTTEEAVRMIQNGECGMFNPRLMDCFEQAEAEMSAMVHSGMEVFHAQASGQ